MTNSYNEALVAADNSLRIEIEALQKFSENFLENLRPAIEVVAQCKGMVVLTGLGKTGLIAAKISATLSSTGTPSFFLHAADSLHGDSGSLRSGDVLISISNAGETYEVIQVSKIAQSIDCKVIAFTRNIDSSLGKLADVVVQVSYDTESDPLNMAPTTSTLLALATGDALASGLIAYRGFSGVDFKRYHPGGSLGAS